MAWENDKLLIDFKQDILSNAQKIKEDFDKGDNILQKKNQKAIKRSVFKINIFFILQ